VTGEPASIELVVAPGQAFQVGGGHEAWVVGDEPCRALDVAELPGRVGA
jgi:hypothetical protein